MREEIVILVETEADRRSGDRRKQPRRAERRPLDPLFAATLVNQITPAETTYTRGYQQQSGPRAGIAFNLSA